MDPDIEKYLRDETLIFLLRYKGKQLLNAAQHFLVIAGIGFSDGDNCGVSIKKISNKLVLCC